MNEKIEKIVKKDEKGRLHCTTGPAIEINGSYKEYWINGVKIKPKFFAKSVKALRELRKRHEQL